MAQVDLTTYCVIVIWTFIVFLIGFLFFVSFFFPLFIIKIKLFAKWFIGSFLMLYSVSTFVCLYSNSLVFYEILDFVKKVLR